LQVANVVGRAEMLAAIFFLLAFAQFREYTTIQRPAALIIMFVLAIAALLSKETVR
jgi:hypothetical protein